MHSIICYWHQAADPFFNMAFDDAMLGQVLKHPDSACLRLYSWNQGTITIGLNQKPERALCLERLGSTPVIRRSTGGRAVFHDTSELTYSVALNTDHLPLSGWDKSLNYTYLRISEGLQSFLRQLGITTQIVRRSGADMGESVSGSVKSCFASKARYELVAGNTKILASAQRQIRTGILQHGSIKVSGAAPHPALPDLPAADIPSVQPLDRSNLESLADIFGRSMSGVLGESEFILSGAADPFPDLAQRQLALRENPLMKRAI